VALPYKNTYLVLQLPAIATHTLKVPVVMAPTPGPSSGKKPRASTRKAGERRPALPSSDPASKSDSQNEPVEDDDSDTNRKKPSKRRRTAPAAGPSKTYEPDTQEELADEERNGTKVMAASNRIKLEAESVKHHSEKPEQQRNLEHLRRVMLQTAQPGQPDQQPKWLAHDDAAQGLPEYPLPFLERTVP
jgi:hypothetical protein